MIRLDSSLAKGYARAFLDTNPEQSKIDKWLSTPSALMAVKTYRTFCKARTSKRGQQLKRLEKFTSPLFNISNIRDADQDRPYIEAMALGQARETAVLDVSYQDQEFFNERAIFLTTMMIGPSYKHPDRNMVGTYITSNMSHHALQRMLWRGVATPSTLKSSALEVLKRARFLGDAIDDHELMDFNDSVLMPIPGGAAICTFSSVRAVETRSDPIDIASVRTVLSDDMLRPGQRDGFAEFEYLYDSDTSNTSSIIDWARKNVLPAQRKGIPA